MNIKMPKMPPSPVKRMEGMPSVSSSKAITKGRAIGKRPDTVPSVKLGFENVRRGFMKQASMMSKLKDYTTKYRPGGKEDWRGTPKEQAKRKKEEEKWQQHARTLRV